MFFEVLYYLLSLLLFNKYSFLFILAVTRSQWTDDQREAVFRQLSHCVNLLKVPKKSDVEEAISKEDILRDIPWRRIKDLVYYKITSRKLHLM